MKRLKLAILGTALMATQGLWANAPISWYASRPLVQQIDWTQGHGPDALITRQAYVLGELSNRIYEATASKRNVDVLGFHEIKYVNEKAEIGAKDIETFVRAGSGDLVGALVGGSALSDITATATAFVVEEDTAAVRVVAVRGSADMADVLTDGNGGTIVSDGGVIYHHGFFVYAKLLYPKVRAALGKTCGSRTPLWLTGHSLGGATATLLALWLNRDGCKVTGVMTFGAPTAGMGTFKKAYGDAGLQNITHQFANFKDPVACLPLGPSWPRVGVKHHIEKSQLFLRDGRDICDGAGESLEAAIYGYFVKVHDVLDVSMDISEWLDSVLVDIGICKQKKKAVRIILGILTGGGSELTCRAVDDTTDLMSVNDQVKRLSLLLFSGKKPAGHYMEEGYLNRIADHESFTRKRPFCDIIWWPRLKQLGALGPCT